MQRPIQITGVARLARWQPGPHGPGPHGPHWGAGPTGGAGMGGAGVGLGLGGWWPTLQVVGLAVAALSLTTRVDDEGDADGDLDEAEFEHRRNP